MSKSVLLNKQQLEKILQLSGYDTINNKGGTYPSFYSSFVQNSSKLLKGTPQDVFTDILSTKEIKGSGNNMQDIQNFLSFFDGKFSIPETFTILLMPSNLSYKNHTAHHKSLLNFLSTLIDEQQIFTMIDSYLSNFNDSNTFLVNTWLDIAKDNLHIVNIKNLEKISTSLITKSHYGTEYKRTNLKVLVFLNNFKDNVADISKYIEDNQQDALFLNAAKKITNKINGLQWKDEDIPSTISKNIVGQIEINTEFFIKKFGFTRSQSEKFINQSLNFICSKFKEFSYYSTGTTFTITAKSVDDYKDKEDFFNQTFEKIKLLAPYWNNKNNKEANYELFENYLDKAKIFEELNDTLSKNGNTPAKTKKSKI